MVWLPRRGEMPARLSTSQTHICPSLVLLVNLSYCFLVQHVLMHIDLTGSRASKRGNVRGTTKNERGLSPPSLPPLFLSRILSLTPLSLVRLLSGSCNCLLCVSLRVFVVSVCLCVCVCTLGKRSCRTCTEPGWEVEGEAEI